MTRKYRLHFWGMAILTAVVLASFMWSNALAAGKKKQRSSKAKSQKIFVINTDFGMAYDDNIIDYSEADLATFDSLSTIEKFTGLKSKNDWILTPQIRPQIRGRLLGGQQASLALEYDYYYYVRNSVRRYSKFIIEGKHYFMPAGYIQVTYSYVPNYFYRNEPTGLFTPYIDSTSTPPRRRLSANYDKAKFTKNQIAAEVGYDFAKTIRGSAIYQYQHKSYNQVFEARDIDINRGEINGSWKARPNLRLSADYGFERGRSKLSGTMDSLDVSYDAWDITLGGRYNLPVYLSYKPDIFGSMQFRRIIEQSSNFNDIYRVGRKDNNYQLRLGTSLTVLYGVKTEISYSYIRKKARVPNLYPDPIRNIQLTVADIERELDYTSNMISLRFTRDF
jgi:hypothetical protein